ncbi:MAG TPA: hypothetical protein VI653_25465 [Steroidobacteraceae bacterium]
MNELSGEQIVEEFLSFSPAAYLVDVELLYQLSHHGCQGVGLLELLPHLDAGIIQLKVSPCPGMQQHQAVFQLSTDYLGIAYVLVQL